MNLQPSIKSFLLGATIGLLIAIVCWSYSVYFYSSISLVEGVVVSLLLALVFGIVASLGNIDKLIDNLPFL